MANTAWIIRIYKVPGVGWRTLKPVFSNTYKVSRCLRHGRSSVMKS